MLREIGARDRISLPLNSTPLPRDESRDRKRRHAFGSSGRAAIGPLFLPGLVGGVLPLSRAGRGSPLEAA